MPPRLKASADTENLDNKSLFERSLVRTRELMRRDVQLQAVRPSEAIVDELGRSCRNSIDFLSAACRLYAERPALGHRVARAARDSSQNRTKVTYLPEFQTLTFAELWDRIVSLASGMGHGGISKTGDRVAICGFPSPDCLVADFACLYFAGTSIPLPTSASDADFRHMMEEADLRCVCCSLDALQRIVEIVPQCPAIRDLIVTDFDEGNDLEVGHFQELSERLKKTGSSIKVRTIGEVESIGRQCGALPAVLPGADSDPLMTVVYTSGTTGRPKGALYNESVWSRYWLQILQSFFPEIPLIAVNFMPLNHLMSRIGIIRRLLHGGTTHFTLKSDMSTLFEDIRLVRPTTLNLVPRVAQMIYQHYQLEVMRRSAGNATTQREAVEAEVMEEMRSTYLGDRLLLLSNGSAPLSRETLAFLKRCFLVPVVDGYASTEAGFISRSNRIQSGNISDYKLVDVPELRYFTSDKPYPRGELRLKGRLSISGYWKSPEASRDLFDEEGYLKTGDIVEERGPGHVVWIDRTNNVLKLSHGEFVSLGRLEAIYAGGGKFISQLYLYGSSERAYLLAVVVPNHETIRVALGQEHSRQEVLREKIRKEINDIAGQHQLRAYEIPREFIIEAEPFSVENGLLTESQKLSRPQLRARYGERLEELYRSLEDQQLAKIANLKTVSSAASVEELLRGALETTLGITGIKLDDRLADLGGDSLDSVYFSTLVQRVCGVLLPVGFILDPASTIRDLALYVGSRLDAAGNNPPLTFADLHGDGAAKIAAEDLRLERLFTPQEVSEAELLLKTADCGQANTVLLTGANGFLGRTLTLELMDALVRNGGKLYCIVRGRNDEAALGRLLDAMGRMDGRNQEELRQFVSEGRLSVFAGDLMKPAFGLGDDAYRRLTREVDCIIHNAALVNHALSYVQLFEPNVLGTVEVMKLAVKARRKSISFISSIAVTAGLAHEGLIHEDEDVRALCPERPTGGGYAAGYAASKWAGEVMLRELHQRTGTPIQVFRCGMILADSRQSGHINAKDWFTRLLCGLVCTQLAPESFYEAPDIRGSAHVGGLPVDFVGRFIVATALRKGTDYATYHVINPDTDSPVSLDLIVDWIRSAGYRITRIRDYDLWYRLFNERLQALDDTQRQRSPLPIIHQWQMPIREIYEAGLDARGFVGRLKEISSAEGVALQLPKLTEAYLHKCLRDIGSVNK